MHVGPRLATAMRAVNRGTYEDVKYVGRPPSAATATGFATLHAAQQKELVQKALQSAPISHYQVILVTTSIEEWELEN